LPSANWKMYRSLFLLSAILALSLLVTTQRSEGAVLEDFILTAEKATAFFQGVSATDTQAELDEEATEQKTTAEIEREATKTPDEVAQEAAETAEESRGEL